MKPLTGTLVSLKLGSNLTVPRAIEWLYRVSKHIGFKEASSVTMKRKILHIYIRSANFDYVSNAPDLPPIWIKVKFT